MQVPIALREEDAASLGSHRLTAMREDGPGLVRASGLLKEARNLGFYVKFLGFSRPFFQALPKGCMDQIIHICELDSVHGNPLTASG